jgi:bacillithiol system protein YtxJ
MIHWISLERSDQLDELTRLSYNSPVIVFKHSTSCSISSMAKMRLESSWNFEESTLPAYYLDLIRHRKMK